MATGEEFAETPVLDYLRMAFRANFISWLIGSQFDSYHLNGHLLGLLMFAIALIMPHRDPVE